MEMHCRPIHRLPEDLWIEGIIALDEEEGLYTFYRAITNPVQEIERNLVKAGAKDIIFFEGFKQQLIAIVRPLNDAIRAKKMNQENHLSSPPEELSCSAET